MANQRLTDKTALVTNTANDDQLMVVDTSDTTGSSVGTSKKVAAKYIIQTDTVTGNFDLSTTPLTLVGIPGAGYFIQPITITVVYTYATSPTATGSTMYFGYISGNTTNVITNQRDMFKNEVADRTYMFGASSTPGDGTINASPNNLPLFMYATADLTGAGGSFKVYTTYQIVKL
jgi:hypothetical protein